MTDLEQRVIDLTIQVRKQEWWMETQPWHGLPINPSDRVQANRKLRDLRYALSDAVDELVEAQPE